MPTGYTAKVMEDDSQTFQQFAMQCARAFGALVLMRDDPMDAPIPETFEPSDYHVNALKAAQDQLGMLSAMSHDERVAYGERVVNERIDEQQKSKERAARENTRLRRMMDAVTKWVPPSPDHEAMRDFMMNQLKISLHDMGYYEGRAAQFPIEAWDDALESAARSVTYHTVEMRKEKQRAEDRTRWV